jgi:hypothetical protein
MFKRVFPKALAWAGLVALCGAFALAQDATPSTENAVRTDGQIEMDVVHALDASQELKNDLITAATIQGEVTLSGTVSVASSRELAESIAGHVPGVTKVNNNLKVGNAQNPPAAQDTAGGQEGDAGDSQPAVAPSDADAQVRAAIRAEVQSQIQAQRQARAQDSSSSTPPPSPVYEEPKGPVTIPQGTLLQLRTSEPVGSKHAKDGQPVQFMVIRDVAVGGVLAIPRGATVHGVVSEVKQAGDLKGSPELALKLTSLDLGGQSYPLDTGQFKVKGPGKGARTANNMVGGTVMGTIIGCAVRGPLGCGVGAGAGLAAGTAASAATPGPNVWIPAEALVEFHLNASLTVTPVSAKEAARLAQGLFSGGPALYRRGYGPYGQPYPYAYGYPPVYYHPYYAVGGFYYWR